MTITIDNVTFECEKAADIRRLMNKQLKEEADRVQTRHAENVKQEKADEKTASEWAQELHTSKVRIVRDMYYSGTRTVTRKFAEILPDGTIDKDSTISITREYSLYY